MENNDNQHKRRLHYAGKYPRKFEEKYKEFDTKIRKRQNFIANGKISGMVYFK